MAHSTHDGLGCEACGERDNRVIDSRYYGNHLTRRRRCKCGHRWTTVEIPRAEWLELTHETGRTPPRMRRFAKDIARQKRRKQLLEAIR